eukprot:jgi/Chrzof1/2781/Cz11g29060.t1
MRLVAGQGDAGQQQHQEMPTSLAARLQQRHAAATASKQQLPAPQPTQISDFTCSSADILTEQQRRQWGFGDLGRVDLGKSGASALRDSHVLYKARQLTQDELVMALKRVFEEYNLWDGGTSRSEMDKIRFQRCVRDSKLIQEMGCLTAAQVDHVFHKIKPHTRSKVNFVQFMEGLRHISMHHRISLNEVIERIVVVGGPNRLSSDSNQ